MAGGRRCVVGKARHIYTHIYTAPVVRKEVSGGEDETTGGGGGRR